MSAPLFATDNIGIVHHVRAADSLSARVVTLCQHKAFVPSKPLTAVRPHPDAFCASCLEVERRHSGVREQTAAEPTASSAVSTLSTPTPEE